MYYFDKNLMKKDVRHTIYWLIYCFIDLIFSIPFYLNLNTIFNSASLSLFEILLIISTDSLYLIILIYHKIKRLLELRKLFKSSDETVQKNEIAILDSYSKLGHIKIMGVITYYTFLLFSLFPIRIINHIRYSRVIEQSDIIFLIVFLALFILALKKTIKKIRAYKSLDNNKLDKAA